MSTLVISSSQDWIVPSGVTRVHIEAWGARGGRNVAFPASLGGNGGMSRGTLLVCPGQTLSILIGGVGGDAQGFFPGAGGTNGGGNGGTNSGNADGAGGGGYSSVSRDNQLILIAAGGGGGGSTSAGGAGGGLVGDPGGDGGGGAPGQGGDQVMGGAAGGVGATPGSALQGGNGALGGGGGGGGYFGGGGGSTTVLVLSSGGGGGSSFLLPSLLDQGTTSNVISPDPLGNGQVVLSWTPNFFVRCPRNICLATDRRCTQVCWKTRPGVKCDPPSGTFFPLGTTRVRCTAKQDLCRQSCSFSVTLFQSCQGKT